MATRVDSPAADTSDGIRSMAVDRWSGAISLRRITHTVLGLMWLATAAWSLLAGLDYYRLPLFDRAYSDLHELYKPSGIVGHGYGIVGSLFMIVGVSMYSLRKRWMRLHSVGRLRNWLTAHIFLCTLGPFLVVVHTAFRFGGIISVAFWSMLIVVASGVFGRYVYVRIPKTIDGEFVSESLLTARKNKLIRELSEDLSLSSEELEILLATDRPSDSRGLGAAIWAALSADFRRRRLPGRFEKRLRMLNVDSTAIERTIPRLMGASRIQQQILVMMPFQRLFGYWHVFHLPLAIIMFLIMFLHIGVAITFGYYWIS